MMTDAQQIWNKAVEKLRLRMSPSAFAVWCTESSAQSLVDNHLVVNVPATGVQQQRFQEQARVAVSEVLGERAEILLIPRTPPHVYNQLSPSTPLAQSGLSLGSSHRRERVPSCRPNKSPMLATAGADRRDRKLSAPAMLPYQLALPSRGEYGQAYRDPGDLHPRYAFDNFVVGQANQLAFAAAQEIANHPGEQYNPLLICGGPGLGKTHLLQAIGHYTEQRGLAITYVTAERFANEITLAIRQQLTDEFRARYRAADVLLVDDIQFIAGKEATEEEFFHTFNALHDAGKQIVLTSDRMPRAMSHLHARLRSRFQWGLIADIDVPSFEHRLSILRAKASLMPVIIPDEVLVCLARPACESVRALEGSLNRVVASAQILGRPLDTRLAAWTLDPLASDRAARAPDDVIAAVARYFGLAVAALQSASRERAIAWARQVAMYMLREETSASLFRIGQQLGGRDHTTVLHGCQRVGQALAQDDLARADISAIRAALRR